MAGGPYAIEMPMTEILDYYQGPVSDFWVSVGSEELWAELTAAVGEGDEIIMYASVPEQRASVSVQAVVVAINPDTRSFEIVV